MSESFVGCNLFVFFKSIIDMQMIWRWSSRAAAALKYLEFVLWINRRTPASLRAQWRCLAFSKTTILDTQPICQIKHHKESFQSNRGGKLSLFLSCKVLGNVTCLLKSVCLGCWLTDLWNIQGCYGRTEKRLCVWPTVLFPHGQPECPAPRMFTQTPKTRITKKKKKERPHISVGVLWGYHTCRMCWIKNRPPKNLPHSESGIVGVKSRKA